MTNNDRAPDALDFSSTPSPEAMRAAHDAFVVGTPYGEMTLDVARVAAATTERATSQLVGAIDVLMKAAELTDQILRGDSPFDEETDISNVTQARMTVAFSVEAAGEAIREIALKTFGLVQAPALIVTDASKEMMEGIARDEAEECAARAKGEVGDN